MSLCLYISPRNSKYSGGRTMCGPTGGMYSKCWLPIIKCTCRERSIPALPRGKTTHVALFKTCYKIYACPGRRGRRPLQIREKFGTKFAGEVSHSYRRGQVTLSYQKIASLSQIFYVSIQPSPKIIYRQYRIILSADTASEVRQMPSQKRR